MLLLMASYSLTLYCTYSHLCSALNCSACRLKEVEKGELELEVNWYSVLDKQNSP